MKTSVKIGIVAALPLTLAVALPTAFIATAYNNMSETHILSINDFHGAAPGYGDKDFTTNKANAGAIRLAQETQDIITKYPGSLLVSAGDLNAGESFSTVSQAKTFYPVLKAMDIKFSAVGNHAWEWAWSDDQFKQYSALAKPDDTEGQYFITSNVLTDKQFREKEWCVDYYNDQFWQDYKLWDQNRLTWADPYKLIDMNGHKVCFIGLTTKDTLKDGNFTAVQNLSFIDYNASICYSKVKLYSDLKDEGKIDDYDKIEAFIIDSHCECEPTLNGGMKGETIELAKNLTTKVDAIISAHSHRTCAGYVKNNNFGNTIAVGQAGQSGRYFLDLKLKFNDNMAQGHRLHSINVEVKKPNIEYGAGGFDNPDLETASKQIDDIVANTKSDIVKNTAKVFNEQKVIALKELKQEVGKIDANMNYYYTEHTERSFGTQYMQSPTLLEKAGVWTNKAQIYEFNKYYEKGWKEEQKFYPASIAITNVDSLKNGFLFSKGETGSHTVIKNDIFSMHAFENPIHYGTMTVKQLEQYIDYILEGACKFNYSSKPGYDQTLYLDDEHKEPIVWDKTETVNDNKELGTSYVSATNQFYGFSFEVQPDPEIRKETDPVTKIQYTYKVYKYKPDSLTIFNPLNSSNDFDNPETWTKCTEWTANNGLIPYVVASFTWQGGNAQNRMLHHWTEYNAIKDPKGGHAMFSKSTRDVALMYADDQTVAGQMLNYGITDDLINKLIRSM